MDRTDFLQDDNWLGSFYECAIELGPAGDDLRASQALEALWSQPQLRGPWKEREQFSSEPDSALFTPNNAHLYGTLTFGGGVELGCMSAFIRIEGKSDWLDLCIPTGMLELRFSVNYPLDLATNGWLVEFERELAQIGARVYEVTRYRLGLLGEEASGACSAAELTAAQCDRGGYLVPEDLWRKLSPKRKADVIVPGLVYAPNAGQQITFGS